MASGPLDSEKYGSSVATKPGRRWEFVDRFAEVRSRWVTLIGEHLRDDAGALLEYWRVDRASSVIVLPLHIGTLLLGKPSWRPGVARATLDFPGGRLPAGVAPATYAPLVLARELSLELAAIEDLQPITPSEGWAVDSSFSTQRLHGFLAQLGDEAEVPPASIGQRVPVDTAGVEALLGRLDCLQCRALLLQWLRTRDVP